MSRGLDRDLYLVIYISRDLHSREIYILEISIW